MWHQFACCQTSAHLTGDVNGAIANHDLSVCDTAVERARVSCRSSLVPSQNS